MVVYNSFLWQWFLFLYYNLEKGKVWVLCKMELYRKTFLQIAFPKMVCLREEKCGNVWG
ncbi:hypothetical protein PU02_1125 [Bartonella ancashensis]|uniref:Uncharacterized protein n=1 Tax=Bartonella ancashensis TaxID=1318743 RepID=A0A0M4LKE6_9HYPH|nr:hypothetical protein PU02_1125 [Bartonella ancashensis]